MYIYTYIYIVYAGNTVKLVAHKPWDRTARRDWLDDTASLNILTGRLHETDKWWRVPPITHGPLMSRLSLSFI